MQPSKRESFSYSIAQAAHQIGASSTQLRYWEEKILCFNPLRNNRHRTYTPSDIRLGKRILGFLQKGASLDKINQHFEQELQQGHKAQPIAIPKLNKDVLKDIAGIKAQADKVIAKIEADLEDWS